MSGSCDGGTFVVKEGSNETETGVRIAIKYGKNFGSRYRTNMERSSVAIIRPDRIHLSVNVGAKDGYYDVYETKSAFVLARTFCNEYFDGNVRIIPCNEYARSTMAVSSKELAVIVRKRHGIDESDTYSKLVLSAKVIRDNVVIYKEDLA